MPFNGSGVYNPITSPDFPAVAATTIRAAQYNNEINDLAVALTNCVTRDGQSPATADLPMGGNKHTNVSAAALRTQYARAAEVQDSTLTYLTSVAGVDTITAIAPLALAAYTIGQTFRFIAAGTNNSSAVTLNVNGLGATAITKRGATALVAGDIPAGSIVQVTYDGARFQLQTPTFLQQATSYMSAVVGGTADAITATFSPAIAALPTAPGTISVIVRAGAANATTTPTFAPDGLTAKTIVKGNNLALAAGDIAGAGHWLEMNFDSALGKWVLLNPYNVGLRAASTAEAQAYTSDAVALTPLKMQQAMQGANVSASTNGYQKLPSGLIIQWYRVSMAAGASTQTFNHPIAFPNAVFVATNTQSMATGVTGAAMLASLTTTQIGLANNGGASGANTTHIIVIGY